MINQSLKEWRKSRGLTQVSLSKAIDIPQSTISAWENGVNIPNMADCIKLADFYEITLDELVGRNFKKNW
ncbi:MAG: helix-turn-helix transcriptional regulator [Clostridiales bacterium]|nr:helix-turn-helix transcriptional regulator [Clostridiales bacterium]